MHHQKLKIKVVSAPTLDAWKGEFLFLHGMAFTSKNWVDLQSLQLLAALGHRAIAIDLPGESLMAVSFKNLTLIIFW